MPESQPLPNGDAAAEAGSASVTQPGPSGDAPGEEPEHTDPPDHEELETHITQLEAAASEVAAVAGDGGGEAVRQLLNALVGIRTQTQRFAAERSGLQVCVADALKQAESLAAENVELRRLSEDALLDKQLQRAQSETEKLAAAAESYKRDLLRQRAADAEQELAAARDRLKETTSDNEGLRALVKELRTQLRAGAPPAAPPADLGGDGPAPLSAKEREEVAVKLLAGEGKPIDAQVLVLAAKGLRDTAVLEAHLQSTIQEKERLALNVEELNDIVFSKTFQPPSAWADRERKYKMEKRDWEIDLKRLRDQMARLREENRKYREVNRAAEFEAAAGQLRAQLAATEADKVAALKEVHELKMRLRRNDGEFTSDGRRSPYKSPFSTSGSMPTKPQRAPDASATTSPVLAGHQLEICPDAEVQATIAGLEKSGIGTQVPTRVFRYEAPRHSRSSSRDDRAPPDARATTYDSMRTSSATGDTAASVRGAFNAAGIHPEAPVDPARAASGSSLEGRRSGSSGDALGDASQPPRGLVLGGVAHFSQQQDAALARTVSLSDGVAVTAGSSATAAQQPPRRSTSMSAGDATPSPAAAGADGANGPPPNPFNGPPASPGSAGRPASGSPGMTMDGLLRTYSTAAGSPKSPHPSDPQSGAAQREGDDVTFVSIADLSPDSAAAAVAAAAACHQQDGAASGSLANGGIDWGVQGSGGMAGGGSGGSAAAAAASGREELYKMYSEHIEQEDVGALKWQNAELESRNEMYQAQLQKAQRALERSDQDKGKLEQELATALSAASSGDKMTLNAMRERLAGLVSRRSTREEEAAEKVKEVEAALQNAHRERQTLQKAVHKLEKQLARVNAALGPAAAAALDSSEAGSEPGDESQPTSRSPSAMGAGYEGVMHGLSEEDMDIMRLREENDLLMQSLVRSKLEMAETQSDYVKTKRALIRAVEKQADMSERMDLLKAELEWGTSPQRPPPLPAGGAAGAAADGTAPAAVPSRWDAAASAAAASVQGMFASRVKAEAAPELEPTKLDL